MSEFEVPSRKSLREDVFEFLKGEILSGKLAPGTRLMEVSLAEELDVSRTPVREATRMLAREGLVVIEPRRGAYVAEFSMKDIVDTLLVRANVESLAASLAAKEFTKEDIDELNAMTDSYRAAVDSGNVRDMIRLDENFHRRIVELSRNKALIRISRSLNEMALRFRYLYYDHFSTYRHQPEEHADIIRAIETGDSERAGKTAHDYVMRLIEYLETEGFSAAGMTRE